MLSHKKLTVFKKFLRSPLNFILENRDQRHLSILKNFKAVFYFLWISLLKNLHVKEMVEKHTIYYYKYITLIKNEERENYLKMFCKFNNLCKWILVELICNSYITESVITITNIHFPIMKKNDRQKSQPEPEMFWKKSVLKNSHETPAPECIF